MFRIGLFQRLSSTAARSFATLPRNVAPLASGLRLSPISTTFSKIQALHEPFLRNPQWIPMINPVAEPEANPLENVDNTMHMDSVLRKRRLKMKKHKLRKRRRLQRSLKKRLGKI